MNLTAMVGGTVLIDRHLIADGVVLLEGGRITAAGAAADIPIPAGASRLDASGHTVAPGFVDIHIHGSGGCRAEDDAPGMARHIVRHGTTWFLPTFISNEIGQMLAAIDHVRSCVGPVPDGATIGGIHLEGPFLNPKYGAQRPESNIEPEPRWVCQLIERCGDCLKLVTIAPERRGAIEAIRAFRRTGATVAIGHSDATESEYLAARAAGLSHATHLFNAMPPRQWPTAQTFRGTKTVGVEELILADDGVSADILCDATSAHVHPALLRLACKCKGEGKLSLITDAMPVAGIPVREFKMADGQSVFMHPGEDVARLANGSLCGSVMSMGGALHNWLKHTGLSLESALTMVSEAPARAVGVFERRGSIAPGKDADLVWLDRDLRVKKVLVGGKEAFCPMSDEARARDFRQLFPVVGHWTYRYNGSIHPCARPVAEAMRAFLTEWQNGGEAAFFGAYEAFGKLKERFARLIGASARNIVVTESTTAAVNLAAQLIRPRAGQNIVVNDLDFMTDTYPWLVSHPEAEVRFVPSQGGRIRPADLAERVDANTAVVSLCAVTVGSGYRFDLPAVHALISPFQIPLLVDGAQALGLVPFDINAPPLDFLATTASKWLLGPAGVGFLYLADRHLAATPPAAGWMSAANVGDWDVRHCRLHEDATRFQGGIPNLVGVVGALAGLELLDQIGLEFIQRRVRLLTTYLLEELDRIGVSIWTPRPDGERAGIVFFRTPDESALHAKLKAARIYCGRFQGGIRVDPAFYNTVEELDKFLAVVRAHANMAA